MRDHPAIHDGIEAVVLDFDGTLADTTPSHEQALRAALQPHGLDLDPGWYLRHAGLSIRDLLAELPGARQLPHDEIIQQSRNYLLATVHSITPIDCVVTLLRAARRAGLPCAIASGASGRLVQPGIEALGLGGTKFAAVIAREDAPRGKPAPTCTSRRPGASMSRPAAALPSTTLPTASPPPAQPACMCSPWPAATWPPPDRTARDRALRFARWGADVVKDATARRARAGRYLRNDGRAATSGSTTHCARRYSSPRSKIPPSDGLEPSPEAVAPGEHDARLALD